MDNLDCESPILKITQGGLYAPLPIPAYKILVAAQEHIAKDVLICLVSHLGLSRKDAWPSYDTIQKEIGRSRGSVSKGIKKLEELGFVKKYQYRFNGKPRNKYYLQDACWNHDRMGADALQYSQIIGRCGCGAQVRNGEVGFGSVSQHHWGCGDVVRLHSTRQFTDH